MSERVVEKKMYAFGYSGFREIELMKMEEERIKRELKEILRSKTDLQSKISWINQKSWEYILKDIFQKYEPVFKRIVEQANEELREEKEDESKDAKKRS